MVLEQEGFRNKKEYNKSILKYNAIISMNNFKFEAINKI